MVDRNKRRFLKHYLHHQVAEIADGLADGLKEAEAQAGFEAFFDSYESSYALTLAYPDDLLLETAQAHGIKTEGREKNDIVKELFKKQGGY